MALTKISIPQKSILEKQKTQTTLNFETVRTNLIANRLQLTFDKTSKEIQGVIELWLN